MYFYNLRAVKTHGQIRIYSLFYFFVFCFFPVSGLFSKVKFMFLRKIYILL